MAKTHRKIQQIPDPDRKRKEPEKGLKDDMHVRITGTSMSSGDFSGMWGTVKAKSKVKKKP